MYFPNLFQEEKIGTCLLRNRLIMSLYPTKYSADSRVNERMIEFYSERARGGVAMIVLDCPCLDFPGAYKGANELRFDTPDFAKGIKTLLKAIHEKGVTILTNTRVIGIEKGKVIIESKDGAKKGLKADSVIFAVGSVQVNSLLESLKGLVEEIYLVGDAKEPGNLGAALRSATEVGLKV